MRTTPPRPRPRGAKPQPLPDFVCPFDPGGDPARVDGWVFNSSGGKDSAAAIDAGVRMLDAAGLLDTLIAEQRIWVQHNGLGDDPDDGVEWAGTCELAAEQAARYGLPFVVSSAARAGDLIDDIATRKTRDGDPRGFPRRQFRYCTREHKTAPSEKFLRVFGKELAERRNIGDRPVVLVQVFGFRAAESPKRAEKQTWTFNERASSIHTRKVYDWLPIHAMSTAEVWASIRASGVPYHPAYMRGMRRLSCRFCALAGAHDLLISARANPGTARRILAVEQATGRPFQDERSMAQIIAEAGPADPLRIEWVRCPTCQVRVLVEVGGQDHGCPRHALTGPWDWHPVDDRRPLCDAAPTAQMSLLDLTSTA